VARGALVFSLRQQAALARWLAAEVLGAAPAGEPDVTEEGPAGEGTAALRLTWPGGESLRLGLAVGAYAAPPAPGAAADAFVVPSGRRAAEEWPAATLTWRDLAERVADYAAAGLLRDADRAFLGEASGTLTAANVEADLPGAVRPFLTAVDSHLRRTLGTAYRPEEHWLEGDWEGALYCGFYFEVATETETGRRWLGVYRREGGGALTLEAGEETLATWDPAEWPLDAAAVAAGVVETLGL